ncbi:MAG TPA: hypothetical protein VHS53_18100 [Mucilaginibacter sp.]|jgi:hypothetical protein|nr:hypothetical protein [Mucilaginibacter sp.]
MRTKSLLLALLVACMLPIMSFKSAPKVGSLKAALAQTSVELGDFESNGVVYSVWGDGYPADGIIDVKIMSTGASVGFSGTYFFNHGWQINVEGPGYSYNGPAGIYY